MKNLSAPNSEGVPPKIIWMLWLQGWDEAPKVARVCRKSWELRNPGWVVHCLDSLTLEHFLPIAIIEKLLATQKPVQALSDQIRLELLHRYGGVWADATAMCVKPLDDWLGGAMPHGFFAFSRPTPERMLSTWFLAAEKGSYIIDQWREASWSYWYGRAAWDSYFWVHEQFAQVYLRDISFRLLWDQTLQISAVHPYHFAPNSEVLLGPPPVDIEADLYAPPCPVFKLTHKFDILPSPNSLFSRLCSFAESPDDPTGGSSALSIRRRLLVGWYGSFYGHGTIGDLRALESVVSHLVGLGHEVFHATAASIAICGAIRVDWREYASEKCDATLFVCGPILQNHPETQAFFHKFSNVDLVGVSVSLLPEDHPNYCNPFKMVFARQGRSEAFGDVAVCAPKVPGVVRNRPPQEGLVVGLAMRGEQHEYGTDQCLWRKAESIFAALTDTLAGYACVRIVPIENHLLRSPFNADEIESQYAACDLVLTTRFHGAVTSLRQNVPFIAVDQIRGGAKVFPLLAGPDWNAVYTVESIEAFDIFRVGLNLLHDPETERLVATRCRHIREANRTLYRLEQWLRSLQ